MKKKITFFNNFEFDSWLQAICVIIVMAIAIIGFLLLYGYALMGG